LTLTVFNRAGHHDVLVVGAVVDAELGR
jgi:hypothetical protein